MIKRYNSAALTNTFEDTPHKGIKIIVVKMQFSLS